MAFGEGKQSARGNEKKSAEKSELGAPESFLNEEENFLSFSVCSSRAGTCTCASRDPRVNDDNPLHLRDCKSGRVGKVRSTNRALGATLDRLEEKVLAASASAAVSFSNSDSAASIEPTSLPDRPAGAPCPFPSTSYSLACAGWERGGEGSARQARAFEVRSRGV